MMRELKRLGHEVVAVARRSDRRSAARWTLALARSFPTVVRTHSLRSADNAWASGASFTLGGVKVQLPGFYAVGAREMYCRDVYLRSGLEMPVSGWVIDLGANRGLFSVWAACAGASSIAVEAQSGYAPLVHSLAQTNKVTDRVVVETTMIGSDAADVPTVGVLVDEKRWATATHADADRPTSMSVPQLLKRHGVDRVGLMKVDIEGGEFSVFSPAGDLSWLERVDQIALELHPEFGEVPLLIDVLITHGFNVSLSDNEGDRVSASHPDVAYAYASR